MRRFDLLVVVALSLLAAFVGREALATRARFRDAERRSTSFGTTRVDSVVPGLDGRAEYVGTTPPPVEAEPAEVLDVRRRLELSAHGTYIDEVITAHDSAVARWPDRKADPLRVWVQAAPGLSGFKAEFVPVVRRAFNEWSSIGIPLSFTFVVDSSMADVHVTWVDRFNEAISGKTLWAHDDAWWIIDAQIQLAVRHQSGEALDSTAVRAIAMHEVGHLIGLDHTGDTTSIMAPKVRVRDLSAADRATAQLVYRLPAGRIGLGPARKR